MLPFFALSLAVVFFALVRLGILDQLPQVLRRGPSRRELRSLSKDPQEERRLEIFKDFFEEDSTPDD